MKKHIVCFGDSNTHGYCADPADCADGGDRFNEEERFPCVLQNLLGDSYLVLEEGLSGRTGVFDDPLTEGLSGISVITPVLMSHEPVDLLIVMLGTNDTKDRFGVNADCIATGMERLIRKAMDTACWGGKPPKILFVCPPPIDERMHRTAIAACMGETCAAKSKQFSAAMKPRAEALGIYWLDASGLSFNTVDYMHLTRKSHAELAELLAEKILREIRL